MNYRQISRDGKKCLILSNEETNSDIVHDDIARPKMEHLSLDCWHQETNSVCESSLLHTITSKCILLQVLSHK